jgi:isopenicillin-N epimerase
MIERLRDLFLLDPAVTYLNHGAYGATPRPVFERHVQWQYELEREPVDFLSRRSTERLAYARQVLAGYLDTERDNLVFVSNGTTGVNIVARSIPLGPGDQLLTTDHEHGGIERLWRFTAQHKGFEIVTHRVPLPVTTHEQFVEDFWAAVTPRVKVILISHLTSPTALVFPVKEICRRARAAGILTVVDGSHVPGQLPLSLRDIDADYYVGILHKWVCAPKGCAFLYVRPDVQAGVEPLVVSWGWEPRNPGPSKFVEYHEWQGSRDISAFLSTTAALDFQREHQWDRVRARCVAMASDVQREIAAMTRQPLYHSAGAREWHGQVVCAQLPPDADDAWLLRTLREEHQIDVSVDRFAGRPRIRVSIQGYNEPEDIDRLMTALKKLTRC